MSDRGVPLTRTPRDRGFTLIEVLIVITMIGFLSASLAAVFTVVVRSTPDADERVNDARSLKGLVTWIPQDMDATPPGGFDDSPAAWPCAGTAPLDSYNVIAMAWDEASDLTTQFDATYRYELRDGEWVIARYSCQDAGTARRVNMTSALPAWNPSSPPAWVEMCSTPIDATTGDCPTLSEVTDPLTEPVESMKVTITLLGGRTFTIDAAAKNPDENLADDPEAVTNYPPVAGVPNVAIDMIAGEPKVLDLYATHLISDPEVNFLTSAVDSYEPMPSGISVTSSDPLTVTIVADPSLPTGPLSDPVSLIVSDAYGGSTDATITINIVLPPNAAPVAASVSYPLTISRGETIILPLDLSHGVSDPNGDPLTLEVPGSSWPAPLTAKPKVGAPLGDLQMEVTVKSDAAVGLVSEPIQTVVKDNRGGEITVETILTIVDPAANAAPTVTPFASPSPSIEVGDSVTLTVVAEDADGDIIWAVPGVPLPAGLAVTTSGLQVVVAADESILPGTYVVPLLVRDWLGAITPISANIVITPPSLPPSSCVLGGLTATPNPVDRQGGGSQAKELAQNVLVTLTYTGSCDGLVLKYDTGDPSGLGVGVGRVFPPGSPTTVELRGKFGGGNEKWIAGPHELTASTTSAVSPNSVSIILTVN